jgi:hypothetical protein
MPKVVETRLNPPSGQEKPVAHARHMARCHLANELVSRHPGLTAGSRDTQPLEAHQHLDLYWLPW